MIVIKDKDELLDAFYSGEIGQYAHVLTNRAETTLSWLVLGRKWQIVFGGITSHDCWKHLDALSRMPVEHSEGWKPSGYDFQKIADWLRGHKATSVLVARDLALVICTQEEATEW